MVNIFLYLLLLCCLTKEALQAAPFIDASLDSTINQSHFPLHGTITITHSKDEKIDDQSFTLEGKPLQVSFIKEIAMSTTSDTLVSIYSFELPAQKEGLYTLPTISVKVEGQHFNTIPSTYEVRDKTDHSSLNNSSNPLIFRLEASVQGSSTLYPGERTKLLYRIFYNRSIDLTRSNLPLIHPAHFQKVGDVQIRDYQIEDVTVQDLIQEIEASELGTFSFGPSSIEGYVYNIQAGQKVYDPKLLKAEAPIITLEVKPFPQSNQPISFTGALGHIQVEASLNSAHSIEVGDILDLQIKVEGISNPEETHLPSLQCQPGVSGFFQISDFPPLAEVKEQTKFFHIELRPLTPLIHYIPSIEFSSFDPNTKEYILQQTMPIPINVAARIVEDATPSFVPLPKPPSSFKNWPTPFLSPLEIKENSNEQVLKQSWLNTAKILWIIPIGFILIMLQKYLHNQWLIYSSKPQVPKSQKLFKIGLKTKNLQILEHAFWSRLWEKGKVPTGLMSLDRFLKREEFIPIYSFLFHLQALQYGQNKNFDFLNLKQEAEKLFEQI